MGSSIQDYLKKINSRLTLLDIFSIFVSVTILAVFLTFLYMQREKESISVTYSKHTGGGIEGEVIIAGVDSRPFASINGKTYTYMWCQGSKVISDKNKVYFNSILEAEKSGRTLSKLCQK